MALPSPIAGVQGARIPLGLALWEDTFVIAPGTSDYVTGGYVISSSALRLLPTYGIMCAWISGQNSTAAGYVPQVTLSLAQIGGVTSGAGFEGYSQLNFQVFQSGGTTPSGTVNIATVTNAGTTKPVYTNTITSVETLTQTTGNASIAGATFTGAAGSAGVLSEVANGGNLANCKWLLTVRGQ